MLARPEHLLYLLGLWGICLYLFIFFSLEDAENHQPKYFVTRGREGELTESITVPGRSEEGEREEERFLFPILSYGPNNQVHLSLSTIFTFPLFLCSLQGCVFSST